MYLKSILFFLILLFVGCSQSLEVLTYNIRYANPNDGINQWDNRRMGLVAQILDLDPDLFGIQEGLHTQVDYLSKQLPAYQFIGVGRDDGNQKGEYSAIYYKPSKFHIVDQGTFWLSETPEKPSVGWDAALERICTYGLFENKQGQRFWLFNTHFDHRGEEARVHSAQLVLDKIANLNTDGYPVILMGDFNLPADHSSIQQIAGEFGMLPYTGPGGDLTTTTNSFNLDFESTRKIDHIFIKPAQSMFQYETLDNRGGGSFLSDHFPVVAKYKLN